MHKSYKNLLLKNMRGQIFSPPRAANILATLRMAIAVSSKRRTNYKMVTLLTMIECMIMGAEEQCRNKGVEKSGSRESWAQAFGSAFTHFLAI